MLQDKKVFLNNNHFFSNVDFHAETMACVRKRAADNEILLMFHNHKDRLRCKWERALDSLVRARCDAQVGLPAATTLHRCLAVSFSCSQSLRNCSSHICLAWAAQYVTLSTSNESAAYPEIRARGQTCPISRHTCLKGIGLPGHRFQNLGGRDDPLFLEEGKKQVSLSSFPSLIIMVSPSTRLRYWQKQRVKCIRLLPKYISGLSSHLCSTAINCAYCSSPSALLPPYHSDTCCAHAAAELTGAQQCRAAPAVLTTSPCLQELNRLRNGHFSSLYSIYENTLEDWHRLKGNLCIGDVLHLWCHAHIALYRQFHLSVHFLHNLFNLAALNDMHIVI